MTQFTLTADQVTTLQAGPPVVLVCGPDGRPLGVLAKSHDDVSSLQNAFTPAEIAEAEDEARTSPLRLSTAEVLSSFDQRRS